MLKLRNIFAPLLLASLVLIPAASPAQEEQPMEQPEAGFRLLTARTVVSFVRQSEPAVVVEPADSPQFEPRWETLLHLSNTGNGHLAATAIFVAEDGTKVHGRRFGNIKPGETITFSVADLIGEGFVDLGPEARGIVIVRFFAPIDAPRDRFFSQMVTAELVGFLEPMAPPQIIPLDVERPQALYPVRTLGPRR